MPTDTRLAKRKLVIEAIAEFVSKDQARKSIELQMGKSSAQEWAAVKNAIGAFGYSTKDEVIQHLEALL